MEYILSPIITCLEITAFFMLASAFLPLKRSKWYMLLPMAGFAAFSTFNTFVRIDAVFSFSTIIFLLVLSVLWLFRGRWYHCMLIVLVGYMLFAVTEVLVVNTAAALVGVELNHLLQMRMLYTVVMLTMKGLDIFLAWQLVRFRKKRSIQLSWKWSLLMVLFPAVSIVTLISQWGPKGDLPTGNAVMCIVLLVADAAILYMINIMEKSEQEAQRVALLNQQLQLQTEHIQALEASYRTQRQLTHDFKNQLQTIQGLLETGKTPEAETYIAQLQGGQALRQPVMLSRHPVVDAVLNLKSQRARELQIDLQLRVEDLSGLAIRSDMLVVLLSNLLDNAIEGAQRAEGEKTICCQMRLQDQLYLAIRNTSLPVKIGPDNHIPTSKKPAQEHGYGLPQCVQLLEMLNAEYALEYRDGWFSFAAEIPNV